MTEPLVSSPRRSCQNIYQGDWKLQLTDSHTEIVVLLKDEDREGNKTLEMMDRGDGARASGVPLPTVGTVRLEIVGVEMLGERRILKITQLSAVWTEAVGSNMDERIECSNSLGRTEEIIGGVCSKTLLEMMVDTSVAGGDCPETEGLRGGAAGGDGNCVELGGGTGVVEMNHYFALKTLERY